LVTKWRRIMVKDSQDAKKIVTLIPGGGWMIEKEGEEETRPLVAWGLTQGGEVVPVEIDSDIVKDGGFILHHPDEYLGWR